MLRKIIFILLIGIATQFVFSSKGVSYGESLSSLEGRIKEVEAQNQELEIDIASFSSCHKISEKSLEAVYGLSMQSSNNFSVALKR
ncbi:hypothetical protein COT64_02175 [Candidatus Shapirobacteria bacterium CG09_land_8_20_14_0_10_39_12]|uniref:Cell division protein FtsL n=1 Tax=Candidatus Shapirobacteria bacterium CG09_land_8_20_14_0_10_39_12 TaxID=1974885 RepID=A0A2H0WRK1_9BACT|nr:MAG: hypothetical protein COT64_02175 [Candidatus Shapirobacteria bacterium CG09_land_8_20_14_0_10_39_12]